METANLRYPLYENEIFELLGTGGAPPHLTECQCLVECLRLLVGDDLRPRQRHEALELLVTEVLDSDRENPQLLAVREYLGWAPHSYDDVIEAARLAGVAHADPLDQRATDNEKQAHRDRLLSNLAVREVFVGRRLNPGAGLTVRRVRTKRSQIARRFLRAFEELLDDTSAVEAFVEEVNSTISASTVSREVEQRNARFTDSTQRDVASVTPGTLFTAVDSETLFVISPNGGRTIYTNRRIRCDTESLDEFYDYYSGSGDPRIQYHFVGEYGCKVDAQSLNSQGRLTGKFGLSKPLTRGAEHTIRYVIKRSDSAYDLPEHKTWVLSLYTEETPTLRERMLVRFEEGARPSRVWWQTTGSSSRIPDDWTENHNLNIDDHGCVEWEIRDMKPNMHYVICWQADN